MEGIARVFSLFPIWFTTIELTDMYGFDVGRSNPCGLGMCATYMYHIEIQRGKTSSYWRFHHGMSIPARFLRFPFQVHFLSAVVVVAPDKSVSPAKASVSGDKVLRCYLQNQKIPDSQLEYSTQYLLRWATDLGSKNNEDSCLRGRKRRRVHRRKNAPF